MLRPQHASEFQKSSLTAHNFKTGGVSLVFFRVDNFSQLHRNLMGSPYEGETQVRSIYGPAYPSHVAASTSTLFNAIM